MLILTLLKKLLYMKELQLVIKLKKKYSGRVPIIVDSSDNIEFENINILYL